MGVGGGESGRRPCGEGGGEWSSGGEDVKG